MIWGFEVCCMVHEYVDPKLVRIPEMSTNSICAMSIKPSLFECGRECQTSPIFALKLFVDSRSHYAALRSIRGSSLINSASSKLIC